MEASGTSRAKTAYGIEIVGGDLIVARADRRGCKLLKRVRMEANGPKGLSDLAEREGARIAAAITVRDSFTQWIEAPFASISKARKVFDSLLDLQIPFPVEDCVRAYTCAGVTPEKNVEALAVGAGKESVAALLEEMQAAGIDPEILDHEGLALWNVAAVDLPLRPGTPRLLIYLGEDRMVIAAGWKNRFGLARSSGIEWEGDRLASQSLARISRRMARLIAAETRGERAEIVICGPRSEDFAGRQDLVAALGLAEQCEYAELDNAASLLACALARRAVGRSTGGLNLRRDEMCHPAIVAAERRRERRQALLALAAGILLCAGNIIFARTLLARKADVQERLQTRAQEVASMATLPPKGMEVKTAREELAKQSAAARRLENLFTPSEGSLALKLAAFAARHGIQLDRVDLRGGDALVAGTAADWDSCRLLNDFMLDAGYLVDLDRQDAGADERVHFSIKGVKGNA